MVLIEDFKFALTSLFTREAMWRLAELLMNFNVAEREEEPLRPRAIVDFINTANSARFLAKNDAYKGLSLTFILYYTAELSKV